MSEKRKFVTASAANMGRLQEEVNAWLDRGYTLHGYIMKDDSGWYHQALKLEEAVMPKAPAPDGALGLPSDTTYLGLPMPDVVTDNQLMTIFPFVNEHGQWVFNDSEKGLCEEALVCGADDLCYKLAEEAGLMDRISQGKPMRVMFSKGVFPNHQYALRKTRIADGGTYYVVADGPTDIGFEIWLCPALLKYFSVAPDELYIRVDSHLNPARLVEGEVV